MNSVPVRTVSSRCTLINLLKRRKFVCFCTITFINSDSSHFTFYYYYYYFSFFLNYMRILITILYFIYKFLFNMHVFVYRSIYLVAAETGNLRTIIIIIKLKVVIYEKKIVYTIYFLIVLENGDQLILRIFRKV